VAVLPAEESALQRQEQELERELSRLQGDISAVRRQNEYLAALHETSLGLIDRLDKEELLEAILQRAALLTGTVHGYIYLLEPDASAMQMRVGMGFFKSRIGLRVFPGEGLGGKVWQKRKNSYWSMIIAPGAAGWLARPSTRCVPSWAFP